MSWLDPFILFFKDGVQLAARRRIALGDGLTVEDDPANDQLILRAPGGGSGGGGEGSAGGETTTIHFTDDRPLTFLTFDGGNYSGPEIALPTDATTAYVMVHYGAEVWTTDATLHLFDVVLAMDIDGTGTWATAETLDGHGGFGVASIDGFLLGHGGGGIWPASASTTCVLRRMPAGGYPAKIRVMVATTGGVPPLQCAKAWAYATVHSVPPPP